LAQAVTFLAFIRKASGTTSDIPSKFDVFVSPSKQPQIKSNLFPFFSFSIRLSPVIHQFNI